MCDWDDDWNFGCDGGVCHYCGKEEEAEEKDRIRMEIWRKVLVAINAMKKAGLRDVPKPPAMPKPTECACTVG